MILVDRTYEHTWAESFSDGNLSVFCCCCCCCCCKLFRFSSSSISRTTGPISTKLVTKHSWVNKIQVCSNEGPCPFLRENKNKQKYIVKIDSKNLLIQNHLANFSQILHNFKKHSWVKGTQIYENKGPFQFSKRRLWFFCHKQGYGTIVALRKCVYWWNCFLCERCGPWASYLNSDHFEWILN